VYIFIRTKSDLTEEPSLTELDLKRDDMLEPIERLFEREFETTYGVAHEPTSERDAHFIYVEKELGGLHAVRFEPSYEDCLFDLDKGMHAAQDMIANQRWVALPLDAFRDGEDEFGEVMREQCKQRGVGIITVQAKGRGLSAKIILHPEVAEGSFIEHYPKLENEWRSVARDRDAAKGWKVVNYS